MKPNAPPIHIRTIFLGILSRNSRDLIKFVRRSVPANKQALDELFNEPKIYAYHITFYRNAFLLKRRDDKYITWRKSLDHHNCKKGADLSFVQCVHTFAPSNCLNNIDQHSSSFSTQMSPIGEFLRVESKIEICTRSKSFAGEMLRSITYFDFRFDTKKRGLWTVYTCRNSVTTQATPLIDCLACHGSEFLPV